MMEVETWTYEDFLTYLFLLVAKADLEISDEEREEITRKVGQEEYTKIKKQFDHQNDAQHIDTLTKLYKKFETRSGGKENIVREVREIITADNRRAKAMEEYLMLMLKRIL